MASANPLRRHASGARWRFWAFILVALAICLAADAAALAASPVSEPYRRAVALKRLGGLPQADRECYARIFADYAHLNRWGRYAVTGRKTHDIFKLDVWRRCGVSV